MLFDTHAHYDDERFSDDRDKLLRGLPASGVSLVLNPGCSVHSSEEVLGLCNTYDFVYGAVGVHPHEAESCGNDTISRLAEMSRHPKVRAIGEIGLDYHYDFSPREAQQVWFREQMALARDLNLPVIIHDREAHADCLRIIKEFPAVRGVYHCYSGSLESAKVLVNLGYSLSFTGTVTYKNARHLPEVAAWLPDESIFIETDAPYLAPEPCRGQRCDSTLLHHTAAKIAALRGVDVETFSERAYQNGKRFFCIE